MKITTILLILCLTTFFTIISQKLISIGGLLIRSALITTIITAFLINSWYGFILFLIYITGLLVLFGYFLAIRPNLHQTAKNCFKAYASVSLFTILVISNYFYKIFKNKLSFEPEVISLIIEKRTPLY